jgi:long-chain acyl-CoA synthetase
VCEGYGLSETSPSVACNPVDLSAFSGHIGVPLPGTEVMLLDDEGQEVAAGTPGELAVRGPQVMAGYWQRPDETARVMTPGGWLRTGDIAVMDRRGNFRIVDRKKDLIFVSGFNVYPGEVEEVLTQMPGVQECAVIGIPDARAGEVVKAIVVRQAPASARPSEAEVRAWCEANLSGYKRPRVVEFRADLPKSPVGKVLRRALREAG